MIARSLSLRPDSGQFVRRRRARSEGFAVRSPNGVIQWT